ncbi:hypothetical protein [Paraburkholderia oxyphila]|uniref:hypothetical protein n=1 Tax=Paraburkholderia oxyphila TaxID=614212 RepID=UPI0012EDC1D8|nr:hypothetical protein [Paraburkholderia oxyphila]
MRASSNIFILMPHHFNDPRNLSRKRIFMIVLTLNANCANPLILFAKITFSFQSGAAEPHNPAMISPHARLSLFPIRNQENFQHSADFSQKSPIRFNARRHDTVASMHHSRPARSGPMKGDGMLAALPPA